MSEFSAQTVLEQLGGKKFIAMTGAKNFVKGKNYIRFKLPKAQNKIKYVKIELNETDTYDIEFQTKNGKVIKKIDRIYFDKLQNIFTQYTGLDTHL